MTASGFAVLTPRFITGSVRNIPASATVPIEVGLNMTASGVAPLTVEWQFGRNPAGTWVTVVNSTTTSGQPLVLTQNLTIATFAAMGITRVRRAASV